MHQMDIPVFELDGYEADDLIGTLAHQIVSLQTTDYSKKEKAVDSRPLAVDQVLIVSGDRDLLQLVNSHVMVLSPLVGLKTLTIYDEQKVEEKYGVTPGQFIDYKALIGDNSDGYPGVSGIGPKTAAGLIRKFETFENLYTHLGDVSPKIAEKLAIDAEQAALAKKLATIITDAPIHIDIEKAEINKVHVENAKEAFTKLGFNSLLKRLDQLTGFVHEKAEVKKEKDKSEQLGLL